MPELPDLTIYLEQLAPRIQGQVLERIRITSPFLLQTVDPPIAAAEGRAVIGLRRVGKRIVIELEGARFLVFHLMIAGRFHWRPPKAPLNRRLGLAALDFAAGTLVLTEASRKRRAAMIEMAAATRSHSSPSATMIQTVPGKPPLPIPQLIRRAGPQKEGIGAKSGA